jgi:hypothetical protein
VKGLAQLGATLGREFPYEIRQAVSPWEEGTLQRELSLPAMYLFKHALIQDAAYQ